MQLLELTEKDAEFNPEFVKACQLEELNATFEVYLPPDDLTTVSAQLSAQAITADRIVAGSITPARISSRYADDRVNIVGFTRRTFRPNVESTATTRTILGNETLVKFIDTPIEIQSVSGMNPQRLEIDTVYRIVGVYGLQLSITSPPEFMDYESAYTELVRRLVIELLEVTTQFDLQMIFGIDSILNVGITRVNGPMSEGPAWSPPNFTSVVGCGINIWGQSFIGETPEELAREIHTWLTFH